MEYADVTFTFNSEAHIMLWLFTVTYRPICEYTNRYAHDSDFKQLLYKGQSISFRTGDLKHRKA